jgi:hypothetical protein
MRFCCGFFENYYASAGTRGFGVFAFTNPDGGKSFVLQHRSLEPNVSIPETSVALSIVAELPLRYCPWCGIELMQFYRTTSQFERTDLKLTLG